MQESELLQGSIVDFAEVGVTRSSTRKGVSVSVKRIDILELGFFRVFGGGEEEGLSECL